MVHDATVGLILTEAPLYVIGRQRIWSAGDLYEHYA